MDATFLIVSVFPEKNSEMTEGNNQLHDLTILLKLCGTLSIPKLVTLMY